MSPTLDRAHDFIYKNARLLDRQLFAYLFRDGSRAAVLQALLAYQNPDGGFGNALEPDKRVPDSQPVDCEMAFHILEMIDALDQPCVPQACDFLQNISTTAGGVPYALPSVMNYPRAGWWNVPPEPPASLNPTASIVGLLLAHGIKHPWLEKAIPYCWQAIAADESTEYHDLLSMITFLQSAPDRQRAEIELSRLRRRIEEHHLVCMDPKASGYVHPPLDWAPTPRHWARGLFSAAVVQADLERLRSAQQEDGGWPISWTPVSQAVELEWRGWKTVQALYMLREYGVVEKG